MSRMHWWIMAVGAVFFLWFFIPAFVVVNIGNITGMAVSALVLLYGIFYRQVQDVAGRLWQTRGGLRMQRQGGAAEPGVERTALRGV